ncbi:MAG: xanthine dehydrogenase family protein subunit M [Candidatus Marinimicrobia bacterium]|nr:xanthine dehydrogenase family protein subunit M [Candidatus Neomarinimicrobiota bacterium]
MKYFRPSSTHELHDYLVDVKEMSIAILAGGTDLMPRWNDDNGLRPDMLIDIKKIHECFGIREYENEIVIGALTTIQEIKNSILIQKYFGALSEAASHFAGVQIRHRATIGGNICNASPAGDMLPGLYAHRADMKVIGPNSSHSIPISDFIVGPGKTVLESNEIISEIHLKKSGDSSCFYKLGLRQSMAIAVVNFAIAYTRDSNNAFTSLNIAAGSVAPSIVFLNHFTDGIMNGTSLDEAIELVDKDIFPIDDIRASADYRRTVLKNVLKYTFRHELHENCE